MDQNNGENEPPIAEQLHVIVEQHHQERERNLQQEWPVRRRIMDAEEADRVREAEQRFLNLRLNPRVIDENQNYHAELDINNKIRPLAVIDADQRGYEGNNLQKLIDYDSIIMQQYFDQDFPIFLKIQALKSQALAKASETQKTALELAQQIATRQGRPIRPFYGLFCFAFMNDTQSFNDFKVFCHDLSPEQVQDQIIAIYDLQVFLPRLVEIREHEQGIKFRKHFTNFTMGIQPEYHDAHNYPGDEHLNRLEEKTKGLRAGPVRAWNGINYNKEDHTVSTAISSSPEQSREAIFQLAKPAEARVLTAQLNQFKNVPQEKVERMRACIPVIQNRLKQYDELLQGYENDLRNAEGDLPRLLNDARAGRNEDALMRQCLQVSQLRLKIEVIDALISGANRQKLSIKWLIYHIENRQALAPGENKVVRQEFDFNHRMIEFAKKDELDKQRENKMQANDDKMDENQIRKLLIRPNTNMQNVQRLQKRVDFLRDEVKDLMKKSW